MMWRYLIRLMISSRLLQRCTGTAPIVAAATGGAVFVEHAPVIVAIRLLIERAQRFHDLVETHARAAWTRAQLRCCFYGASIRGPGCEYSPLLIERQIWVVYDL